MGNRRLRLRRLGLLRVSAATVPPPVLARTVCIAILAAAAGLILVSVLDWRPTHRTASELTLAGIVVVLFAVAFARAVLSVGRPRARPLEQAAEVGICISFAAAMLLVYGAVWDSLSSLAGGAALLGLKNLRRLIVPIGLLVLAVVCTVIHGAGIREIGDVIVLQMLTTVAVGGLGLLAAFALEVERGRADLARMVVVEERLQFSRNLHDVLGRGLSVIQLKSEIVALLLRKDPCVAERELNEIATITRQSIADMRSLVRGYRRMSAVDELAQVESMLTLAGIDCHCDGVPPALPDEVQDVVGWFIREAGTNVLRHSKATECTIRLRIVDATLRATVVNDNAFPPPGQNTPVCGGSGLAGLRERLSAVSGELTSRHTPDGTFELRADIPVRFAPSNGDDRDGIDAGSHPRGDR